VTETQFHNLSFLAAPGSVMVPRPATEALVERALERIGHGPARVADVGTGSGAIAVTLALLAPAAHVWAIDTSRRAVELARTNARRHGVDDRVRIVQGELLEPVTGSFDVIAANLPYLPERLQADEGYADLRGEPADAVFAPGDGLGLYRRLLAESRARLAPGGVLVLQFRGRIYETSSDGVGELDAELGRLAA
jgi:release factor glutamine methyltransferase